jgi:hypothetical protein
MVANFWIRFWRPLCFSFTSFDQVFFVFKAFWALDSQDSSPKNIKCGWGLSYRLGKFPLVKLRFGCFWTLQGFAATRFFEINFSGHFTWLIWNIGFVTGKWKILISDFHILGLFIAKIHKGVRIHSHAQRESKIWQILTFFQGQTVKNC